MPTMSRPVGRLALRALAACAVLPSPAEATTLVGNPGLRILIAPPTDVVLDEASLASVAIAVDRCASGVELRVLPEIDLLEGTREELPDTVCGVAVLGAQTLLVSGHTGSGDPIDLELHLGQVDQVFADVVVHDGSLPSTDLALELGLPGWTSAAELGTGQVNAAHPLHDILVDRLVTGSRTFVRADRPGALTAAERAAGLITP